MDWNKIDLTDASSFPPIDREVLLYIDLSQTTKRPDKYGKFNATYPRIHIGCLRTLFTYYPSFEHSRYFRSYAKSEADLPPDAYDVQIDPHYTTPYTNSAVTHWAYITPPEEHVNQSQSF